MENDKIFSVVIPTISKHDKFLRGIFKNLAPQQDLIREIIVVRTGIKTYWRIPFFTYILMQYVFIYKTPKKLKILFNETKLPAGLSRNLGADAASAPYIVFMDADDDYHPNRLEILRKFINKYRPNIVLHGAFSYLAKPSYKKIEDINFVKLFSDTELRGATFPNGIRNRLQEGTNDGDTNILIPNDSKYKFYYHHGHITVSKNIFDQVRFSSLRWGEDGQFCRDVLEIHDNFLIIKDKLSQYRKLNSARYSKSSVLVRITKNLMIKMYLLYKFSSKSLFHIIYTRKNKNLPTYPRANEDISHKIRMYQITTFNNHNDKNSILWNELGFRNPVKIKRIQNQDTELGLLITYDKVLHDFLEISKKNELLFINQENISFSIAPNDLRKILERFIASNSLDVLIFFNESKYELKINSHLKLLHKAKGSSSFLIKREAAIELKIALSRVLQNYKKNKTSRVKAIWRFLPSSIAVVAPNKNIFSLED